MFFLLHNLQSQRSRCLQKAAEARRCQVSQSECLSFVDLPFARSHWAYKESCNGIAFDIAISNFAPISLSLSLSLALDIYELSYAINSKLPKTG